MTLFMTYIVPWYLKWFTCALPQELKNTLFENLHLMTFVESNRFWPLMMSKMLFLCIGSQKYTFWKFAFDDLWLPWPDFDLSWCPKCFSMHKSSKIRDIVIILSLCQKYTFWQFALGDLWWPWPPPPGFQTIWNYFGVVPLYCSQSFWNFEVSHDFYLQVDLWPNRSAIVQVSRMC